MNLQDFKATSEMEGWLKKKSPKTQGKKMVDIWQRRCAPKLCAVRLLRALHAARRAHASRVPPTMCVRGAARSYFVLSGGELKYYKTEKEAHLSNADSLKAIRLEHVLAATMNPKHPDMFIIDLGMDRKVKLQAGSESERDLWVAAVEASKLKAWSRQEENAFNQVVEHARSSESDCYAAAAASSAGAGLPGGGRAAAGACSSSPAKPSASPFQAGSPQMGGGARAAAAERRGGGPGNAPTPQFQAELLRTPQRKAQGCCVIS